MTVLLDAPAFADKAQTVHYQRPEVRTSTKVTTDHHDRGTKVDTTEHFSDRVDVTVKAGKGAARLLRPVILNPYTEKFGDLKMIVPVDTWEYEVVPIRDYYRSLAQDPNLIEDEGNRVMRGLRGLRGRAITDEAGVVGINLDTKGSGQFATNWGNSLSSGDITITEPVFGLTNTHQRCALFQSISSGSTINFDDTTANSAYNASVWTSTNEVTGTGYSAGGAGDGAASGTFIGPAGPDGSATWVNTAGVYAFSGPNAVWTSSTITASSSGDGAHGGLIYMNKKSDGTALSVKYATVMIDFGAGYTTSGGTMTVQWNAAGVWSISYHS